MNEVFSAMHSYSLKYHGPIPSSFSQMSSECHPGNKAKILHKIRLCRMGAAGKPRHGQVLEMM
jgi:hypothetical protein